MSKRNHIMVNHVIEFIKKKNGIMDKQAIEELNQEMQEAFPNKKWRKGYWSKYREYVINSYSDSFSEEVLNNFANPSEIPDEESKQDRGLQIESVDEKDFTDKFVKPHLESQGHTPDNNRTHKCGGIKPQIDIKSSKANITYFTEVKYDLGNHRLQTAIGQIFFHQFGNRNEQGEFKYQIVFPAKYENNRHFKEGFANYLRKKLGIDIIFVNG